MRWRLLAPVFAVAVAACGSHPPTTPSSTATPTTGSGAPVAAIEVKADAAGSRDAIASLSEVVVDASASAGQGLTFAIDFGDGATATTASATHVYAAPGTYTVAATVTDAEGRKATSTKQIAVRDVRGSWYQAGFVDRTRRVEVRRLGIDAQTGTTVRGTYRVTGDLDRAFTGTLIPPRDIRIATNDGVSLIGTLPGRWNDEAITWTLIPSGDSTDGQRLEFHAIAGAPDGPPPAAHLRISFEGGLFNQPIASLTHVRLDGSSSRGAGLAYFIEFGDGAASAGPQATRVLEGGTPRLTVVDRFGRSASDSPGLFYLATLLSGVQEAGWSGSAGPGTSLGVAFFSRNGVTYKGRIGALCVPETPQCTSFRADAVATLSGVRDIRIDVPSTGTTYQGTVSMSDLGQGVMTLVQSGGAQAGLTWRLIYREAF